MSDKQSNLTDKEMEDLQSIVADTLASVCAMGYWLLWSYREKKCNY